MRPIEININTLFNIYSEALGQGVAGDLVSRLCNTKGITPQGTIKITVTEIEDSLKGLKQDILRKILLETIQKRIGRNSQAPVEQPSQEETSKRKNSPWSRLERS